MILSQILTEKYSYSLKKLENANGAKEKRKILKDLIGNLIYSSTKFSIRKLAGLLKVSRQLITSIIKEFDKNYTKVVKQETRGRKKYEDKHPEVISHIQEFVEKTENIDSRMQDKIIYIDPTLSNIKEHLEKEYSYDKQPCESTISRILKKN